MTVSRLHKELLKKGFHVRSGLAARLSVRELTDTEALGQSLAILAIAALVSHVSGRTAGSFFGLRFKKFGRPKQIKGLAKRC